MTIRQIELATTVATVMFIALMGMSLALMGTESQGLSVPIAFAINALYILANHCLTRSFISSSKRKK